MKTQYIKSPSEKNHWLTKSQTVRTAMAIFWILVGLSLYYAAMNQIFPTQVI